MTIVPAFDIEPPCTARDVPVLKLRLSPVVMARLLIVALISRVTAETSLLPLSIKALSLELGRPCVHILLLLQFPVPPVQMSFVMAGALELYIAEEELTRAYRSRPSPPKRNMLLGAKLK